MSLYITPAQMTLTDNGPRFSATLLRGFTTNFITFDSSTGPLSSNWELVGGTGAVALNQTQNQQGCPVMAVTANQTGEVLFQVSCRDPNTNQTLSMLMEINVEGSTLLIYAPDGFVYQVPATIWGDPSNAIHVSDLSEPIQTLLANEVTVANIPQPPLSQNGTSTTAGLSQNITSTTAGADTTVGNSSDNITCFLLNLNSILLSRTPPRPTTSKPQPVAQPSGDQNP